MESPKESLISAITVEEAYEKSIGQFGPGQIWAVMKVNFSWVIGALVTYLMSLAEKDPIPDGKWKCRDETDLTCMSVMDITDLKELKHAFCKLDPEQWDWTSSMVQLTRSMYFIGWTIGAGVLGYLADEFGRHTALYLSTAICAVFTLAGSLSPTFVFYLVTRFGVGFGNGGTGTTAFILASELIGASVRGKHTFVCQSLFTIGSIGLVGVSVLVNSWRILTFIVSMVCFAYLTTYWFIPRSPRWLMIKGRDEEAMRILESLAKANKKEMPAEDIREATHKEDTKKIIGDIVKHPKLRVWLAINVLTWAIVSTVYYGITLSIDDLPGTFIFKFFVTQVVEIPAYITYLALIDVVGRKPLYVVGFLAGGVSCVLVAVVPRYLVLTMALLGKFAVDGVFGEAYLYTAEMFPTSVRNFTLGLSSLAARAGSIAAPQIALSATVLGSGAPFLIFGGIGVFAGLIALGLPEPMGKPMPTTPQDIDELYPDKKTPKQQWFRFGRGGEYEKLNPEGQQE